MKLADIPTNTLQAQCRIDTPLGPLTLASLCKREEGLSAEALARALLPCYEALLRELRALGVPEVQLHEPWLVRSEGAALEAVTAPPCSSSSRASSSPKQLLPPPQTLTRRPWLKRRGPLPPLRPQHNRVTPREKLSWRSPSPSACGSPRPRPRRRRRRRRLRSPRPTPLLLLHWPLLTPRLQRSQQRHW